MFVNQREALRSIQREAGRQSDFYRARSSDVSDVWQELETQATIALQQSHGLIVLITERDLSLNPHIIKHGEQAQQLQNPLTGKALQ